MKRLLTLLTVTATLPVLADVPPELSRFHKASPEAEPETREAPSFVKDAKQGVQVTELGCMRATFVFDEAAAPYETRVIEAFSDVDFRVFPNGTQIEGRIEPKSLHQIGNDRYADLVVFTRLSTKEQAALGGLKAFEAEAVMQVYNPMSEELLVSETQRAVGKRSADADAAVRDASEKVLDEALEELIFKTLEKAHKILVHEVQLTGVVDHKHLLEILEFSAELDGVYHVRQLTYDKSSGLAVIEIIAAPKTESFWRAYMEDVPQRTVYKEGKRTVILNLNAKLREEHIDWFTE